MCHVCERPGKHVQTSDDVDALIKCMRNRGVIDQNDRGQFVRKFRRIVDGRLI